MLNSKKIVIFLSYLSIVAAAVTLVSYYNLNEESYCRPSDIIIFSMDCGDSISGFLVNLFSPGLFAFELYVAGLAKFDIPAFLFLKLGVHFLTNSLILLGIFCFINFVFKSFKHKGMSA